MQIYKEEAFALFDRCLKYDTRNNGLTEPTQYKYISYAGKKLGVKIVKNPYLKEFYNEWKALRWGGK